MHEISETSKYRHLTVPYCQGNGVDIGCGGDPVVPNAICLDLPPSEYAKYHSGYLPEFPIHYGGDALNLPFKDHTLDYVYSSHLLEDFFDWVPVLHEWKRVLKIGGHLVILVPDKALWKAALDRGQPPNCAHKHESRVGELSWMMETTITGVSTVKDELTNVHPGDYSILYVGRRVR